MLSRTVRMARPDEAHLREGVSKLFGITGKIGSYELIIIPVIPSPRFQLSEHLCRHYGDFLCTIYISLFQPRGTAEDFKDFK